MKIILKLLLLICISAFALNLLNCSTRYSEEPILYDGLDTIVVNFDFNEELATQWKNIYVIWMEDTAGSFIQNLFICQKLITGGTTGTALPFWKTNKYSISSSSEVDAVTSATKANTDFSVTAVLKDSSIRNFDLYFEMDKSFDANDWFTDQPAVLYSVNIDLDDNINEYELVPVGWTPNENTQNKIPNTPSGHLQEEMKYITNHKEDSTFGDPDERSSTRMAKKITASIKRSVATSIISSHANDYGISLFPNPARDRVNIKSKEEILEVTLFNIKGQTINHIQPETFEATLIIDKTIAPKGTYFVKIKTMEGTSTHKLLILE